MKVCPYDDTPVVPTFERPGHEYHCLACGRWLPVLRAQDRTPRSGAEIRLTDLLVTMFSDGARGPIEIPAAPPARLPHPDNIRCDGCGADAGRTRAEGKPSAWYSRQDDGGEQFACSRECIDTIAERTGKTVMVLPW